MEQFNILKKIIVIIKSLLQVVLLALIWSYQLVIRPVLPPSCRFYPSCSEYACQSIRKYGPFKGVWRSVLRLAKCHPWHPGGVDLP